MQIETTHPTDQQIRFIDSSTLPITQIISFLESDPSFFFKKEGGSVDQTLIIWRKGYQNMFDPCLIIKPYLDGKLLTQGRYLGQDVHGPMPDHYDGPQMVMSPSPLPFVQQHQQIEECSVATAIERIGVFVNYVFSSSLFLRIPLFSLV